MVKKTKPVGIKQRRSHRNARGEQSRQTILDVAERHFGEFGYRGASTAAIANEVRISDPGLLHHFGSKDGLLMALLNRRYSRDGEKLRAGEPLQGRALLANLETVATENLQQRDEVRLTMVLLPPRAGDLVLMHDDDACATRVLATMLPDWNKAGRRLIALPPEAA